MSTVRWISAVVLLCGSGQALAATRVNCPLATANRQITNPLPKGWSTVPFAERLTGTRITESGVLQTLVCEYGAAGSIQSAAPADTRCRADAAGFTCDPTVLTDTRRSAKPATVPTAPLVHRSGSVTVRLTTGASKGVDFDTGALVESGGDIGGLSYYVPRGAGTEGWRFDLGSGSKIWLHRGAALGREGCARSEDLFLSSSYSLYLPAVGAHVCYKTNLGRFGEFAVTEFGTAPGDVRFVTVRFTTWQ